MKKSILFAILYFFAISVHAQSPRVISYQGMLRGARAGNHSATITLYSDAGGSQKLWQSTMNVVLDSSGIFNLLLGSDANPLPEAQTLDRPIWLGLAIDSGPELSRSQITASAYALNVADSSITASKLKTNYVSTISVNGQSITGNGTNLNLVGGNGINLNWVPEQSTLTLSSTATGGIGKTMNVGDPWLQGGNYITSPSTEFLGTTDSSAFEIHVNDSGFEGNGNKRIMLYQPMLASVNIIGGWHGNYIGSTDSGGDIIAGGGDSTNPNSIQGDFATVSGGKNNSAYSLGTVAGGGTNFADILGTVGGGTANLAGQNTTIAGGVNNQAADSYSAIGGGNLNFINPTSYGPPFVAGDYSAIGGGVENTIDGPQSAIPGGSILTIGPFSFGFNGDTTVLGASHTTDISAFEKLAYFGNVDLWLGNVDSVARALRFYGPNTDLYYGSGAKYTAFRAPTMDTNVTYTLPSIDGAKYSVLTNDGTGTLSWGPGIENDTIHWAVAGNYHTSPPTNFLGTLDSNSLELHVFDTGSTSYGAKRVMRYEVNDTSANLIGGFHDNGIIPLDTSLHSHIVGVVIAGGGSNGNINTVNGSYAVISGGKDNHDTAYSFVGGGASNHASSSFSSIVGGIGNNVNGSYSIVGGGSNNVINGSYSALNGGTNNIIRGTAGAIGGGDSNWVLDTANYAFIGGGFSNVIDMNASYAGILSGENNFTQGIGSAIAGGYDNRIVDTDSHTGERTGTYSFIGAGTANKIDGQADGDVLIGSAIIAGSNNYIGDGESIIGAGHNNKINDDNSFIDAGEFNTVDDGGVESGIGAGNTNYIAEADCFIGAGNSNSIQPNATNSFVGGGQSNEDSAQSAFIGAGLSNSVFGTYSSIGSGSSNSIGGTASNGFIGAGVNDTVRAPGSVIGGGNKNITTTTFNEGNYSNIPGGDHLIAQSYAQTVIGYVNKPQGTSIGYNPISGAGIRPNPNDRVFIIGNGFDTTVMHGLMTIDSTFRTNAYEVTNGGQSIVYWNNGSGGATPPPPGPPPSFNGAVYGARCQDNTCYAWGDVKEVVGATSFDSTISDFGVDSIVYKGPGQFRVFLHTVDPYTGAQVNFTHGFSVTATSVVHAVGVPLLVTPEVTPLNWVGIGLNAFDIYLVNSSGSVPSGQVMFQVFGRE